MGLFGGDSSSSLEKTDLFSNPIFGQSGSGNTINISPINNGSSAWGSGGSMPGSASRYQQAFHSMMVGGDDGNPPPWSPPPVNAPVAGGGQSLQTGGHGAIAGRDNNIVTLIETDHGAVSGSLSLANNTVQAMRDLSSNAIGANTIIAGQAMDGAFGLANNIQDNAFNFASTMGQASLTNALVMGQTAINAQSQVTGRAMDSSDSNLQAMLALSLGLQDQANRLHATSLDFANMATRSDEAMNSETLIKWGAGAFIAVAAVVWLGMDK